jgi:hypothetical protein
MRTSILFILVLLMTVVGKSYDYKADVGLLEIQPEITKIVNAGGKLVLGTLHYANKMYHPRVFQLIDTALVPAESDSGIPVLDCQTYGDSHLNVVLKGDSFTITNEHYQKIMSLSSQPKLVDISPLPMLLYRDTLFTLSGHISKRQLHKYHYKDNDSIDSYEYVTAKTAFFDSSLFECEDYGEFGGAIQKYNLRNDSLETIDIKNVSAASVVRDSLYLLSMRA